MRHVRRLIGRSLGPQRESTDQHREHSNGTSRAKQREVKPVGEPLPEVAARRIQGHLLCCGSAAEVKPDQPMPGGGLAGRLWLGRMAMRGFDALLESPPAEPTLGLLHAAKRMRAVVQRS